MEAQSCLSFYPRLDSFTNNVVCQYTRLFLGAVLAVSDSYLNLQDQSSKGKTKREIVEFLSQGNIVMMLVLVGVICILLQQLRRATNT